MLTLGNMTFEEFLAKKRIDNAAFETGEPERYWQWKEMYAQMHPNSFLIQVKMIINDVRLRYHLAEVPAQTAAAKPAAKPVVRRAAPAAAKPATPTPAEETDKPARPVVKRPARPAAVIRKPTPEPDQPEKEKSADEPEVVSMPSLIGADEVAAEPAGPEAETNQNKTSAAEKPAPAARPRPVMKRPAALSAPKPAVETEKTDA
ncbi:MAG: hypothetical protein LPJ89_09385, partial [Hymenobacteraceae bacterium]|nr:hypothetical protein [Hymenobacteraceae bacterium]